MTYNLTPVRVDKVPLGSKCIVFITTSPALYYQPSNFHAEPRTEDACRFRQMQIILIAAIRRPNPCMSSCDIMNSIECQVKLPSTNENVPHYNSYASVPVGSGGNVSACMQRASGTPNPVIMFVRFRSIENDSGRTGKLR